MLKKYNGKRKFTTTKKKTDQMVVYKKRRPNSLKFANIYNIPRKMPKFIGYDLSGVVNTTTNATAIQLVNGLAEGTTNETRIGQNCLFKSVEIKAVVRPRYPPSGSGPQNIQVPAIAVTIVYDKKPERVLPTISGSADSIFNGSDPWDLPLFSNNERYVIIANEMFTPENPAQYYVQGSGSTIICQIDYSYTIARYYKMALKGEFNAGNTGGISDFNTGALYIIYRTDATNPGSGVDNSVNIKMDSRVRFQDV